MFSFLYLGLKLMAEKGAENRAQYEIDKYYRETSKMDMWDAMEKQLKDNIAHNSVCKDCVRWKGEKDGELVKTSFRDIDINREFHASGLTKEEFVIKKCLELYENGESLYRFRIYNDDGNYRVYKGKEDSRSNSLVIEAGSEYITNPVKEIPITKEMWKKHYSALKKWVEENKRKSVEF